jgi:hypothetical protein
VSSPPADKVQAFQALCWSRASRWKGGAIADEHDGDGWIGHAVDPLQAWAEAHGLVKEIGQDAVQAIMAQAFADV